MAKSANGALAKLALGIATVAALAGVTGRIASAEQTFPWTADAQPGDGSGYGLDNGANAITQGGGDTFGGQGNQQSALLAPPQSSGATVAPSVPQTGSSTLPGSTRTRHSRRR